MIKTIQARKEKPGEFCGIFKRYPKQAALNLLAEGYTVYSEDMKRHISWRDIEDVLNGKKTIEFNIEEVKK